MSLRYSVAMNWLRACVVVAGVFVTADGRADVRLPKVISDHAVLQRGGPIHIWGWATPGAHLSATFHAQTVLANANELGKWSLYLKPEVAGGPYTLRVTGDGPDVVVNDLLIGDVWIASGQSNMEFPLSGFPPSSLLKDGDKEIAAAENPMLRLLVVDHKTSDFPLNDIHGSWTTCTPATAKVSPLWLTSSAWRLQRTRRCRLGW